MYAWIWRHLPGPTPVRAVLAALLIAAVVVVLFVWVFPWLEPRLPFTNVTVDAQAQFSTGLSTGGDRITSL
jgi:ABC-type transporter Mla subunit MlaD